MLYYVGSLQELVCYSQLCMQVCELCLCIWCGEGGLCGLVIGDVVVIEGYFVYVILDVNVCSFLVSGVYLQVCNNFFVWVEVDLDVLFDDCLQFGQCCICFWVLLYDQLLVFEYVDCLYCLMVNGLQSVIVVGLLGEIVYIDLFGCICICFYWQWVEDCVDGDDVDLVYVFIWIWVVLLSVGDGFGYQFLLCIGQEVLVDFFYGDMDCLVVVGVLYNGWYVLLWFFGVGQLLGNCVLLGIQLCEYGGNVYVEFVFDDSFGEVGVYLCVSLYDSVLYLGQFIILCWDGQVQLCGSGVELCMDVVLVLCLVYGLLLSSYGCMQVCGYQLDQQELLGLLDECCQVFVQLVILVIEQQVGIVSVMLQYVFVEVLKVWIGEGDGGYVLVVVVFVVVGLVIVMLVLQLYVSCGQYDVVVGIYLQQISGECMYLQVGQGLFLYVGDGGISVVVNVGLLQLQLCGDQIQVYVLQGMQFSVENGEIVIVVLVICLVVVDGSFLCIGGGVIGGSDGVICF